MPLLPIYRSVYMYVCMSVCLSLHSMLHLSRSPLVTPSHLYSLINAFICRQRWFTISAAWSIRNDVSRDAIPQECLSTSSPHLSCRGWQMSDKYRREEATSKTRMTSRCLQSVDVDGWIVPLVLLLLLHGVGRRRCFYQLRTADKVDTW